jgi:hypothetical protein
MRQIRLQSTIIEGIDLSTAISLFGAVLLVLTNLLSDRVTALFSPLITFD